MPIQTELKEAEVRIPSRLCIGILGSILDKHLMINSVH